ncbi:MAG: SPFH domain-containing protein [Ruminococcus sp.]|nr:SPFH domain-containing protein [Ruminococcus sp.]
MIEKRGVRMGLFKAAKGSLGGVMADQWLEIYACDSLPQGVLAQRAQKRVSERSANTEGDDNVISDGSTIIVNVGQCALAIDSGEVTGVYDTPGENTYHSDRSPSIFHKGGAKGVLKQSFDRFGYGGVAAVYQVIIVLDLREHMGNPFSVSLPIRIKDSRTGLDFDATLSVSGTFSFQIKKPAVFYKKLCGCSTGTVYVKDILPQITAEFKMTLITAIGKTFRKGSTAYDISMSANKIIDEAAALLNEEWIAKRGFAIVSVGIDSVALKKQDKDLLQSVQLAKTLTDPTLSAATIAAAQAQAMQDAAKNTRRKEPIRVTFNNTPKG